MADAISWLNLPDCEDLKIVYAENNINSVRVQ